MMISDIKPGSVAHRSGALSPGDQLLAINGQPLHNLSLVNICSATIPNPARAHLAHEYLVNDTRRQLFACSCDMNTFVVSSA